jgi:hypothetical protein
LFTQDGDEHADLREKHENATPAVQQAVKSSPDRAKTVSERYCVQLLRDRRVHKSRQIDPCDVLESIMRVMTFDKVIEIKVKPPVDPFEQALNEGAHHSAARQLDQHICIQFPVIDCSLHLCSGLEDVTQYIEAWLTNRKKFPVNLDSDLASTTIRLLRTRTRGIPREKEPELLKRQGEQIAKDY